MGKFEELLARANAAAPARRPPRHIESEIQQACLRWFRAQYPDKARLIFAVPNGGSRNKREAAIMKAEGVTAGVADVLLLVPSGGFASLCIEFKTETGRQQPSQKEWQKAAEAYGNRYEVVRSLEQFMALIRDYLGARR